MRKETTWIHCCILAGGCILALGGLIVSDVLLTFIGWATICAGAYAETRPACETQLLTRRS
jgi:hypothetical protein